MSKATAEAEAKVAAFFQDPGLWQAPLLALRQILRDFPLGETFKWRAPCYTFAGGNVATLWSLKAACGLSFFKGVLLEDPQGLLQAPGPHSRSVRLMRFTSAQEVAAQAAAIRAFLAAAAANEQAGKRVTFAGDDLDWPEELLARLDADPELAAAFHALSPGRQRGYLLHIGQARQSATRATRVEKHAPRILAGKGMHDR